MLELDRSKLKSLRKQKKLKMRELAQQIGKTTSDISNYENSGVFPTANTLLNLMNVFNVSPKEISKEAEVVCESAN